MVERPNAMLTNADREYLRELVSDRSRQAKYERKKSIKSRVPATLHDFSLLVDQHEPDELRDLLELDDVDEDQLIESMVSMIEFLYALRDEVDPSFEELVLRGVRRTIRQESDHPLSVTVDFELDRRAVRLDNMVKKLRIGQSFTDEEYEALCDLLVNQPESFEVVFQGQTAERLAEKVRDREVLNENEREFVLRRLKAKDEPGLWQAVLEAGSLPYDEGDLDQY